MNLTSLTTWASQFAGDPNQSRYTGKYTNAINEAQVQFALDSKALFKDQIWSVVSGQSAYALPSDFMYEKKVTISTINSSDAGIALTPISRAALEFAQTDHDWTQDTGTPKMYIIDPETARNSMTLYPQPQGADAGTNNLRLTYYPYPTLLVNGTDVPLNATGNLIQFHRAIAAYAAWLLTAIEIQDQNTLAKRSGLKKIYEDAATEATDKYGNSSQMQLRLQGGREWR